MKTLVVNLFGSPGSGKSSGAAYIFSRLKKQGVDCQLVTEYAKDKCWQGDYMFQDPTNQFYIGANQYYRVNRVNGKVNVIITDSPVLLSCFYNISPQMGKEYNEVVKRLFNRFNNLNFFVNRVKPYNPNGRIQSVQQSDEMSVNMKQVIRSWNIDFIQVNGDDQGYQKILFDTKKIIYNSYKMYV